MNHTKQSAEELFGIFDTHITEETTVLTDGLRSYESLEAVTGHTVLNVNTKKGT